MKRSSTYGLDLRFERVVAALCITDRSFWGLIGHDVDPEMLEDEICVSVVSACSAAAKDGVMPTPVVIVQRVRRWHEEGKVGERQFKRVRSFVLDTAEDGDAVVDADSVAKELAPVLRRSAESAALDAGYDLFAKRGDLAEVETLLAGARRIGCADTSIGSRLGPDAIDRIAMGASGASFLPTGVRELDAEIRGLRRGGLGIALGSTGAGKSMFLDHVAAEAVSTCVPAALATLELASEDHEARIIGNLVDIPTSDLSMYKSAQKQARERMEVLENDGLLSFLTVKDFTPRATTVADLEAWVSAEEAFYQIEIPLICVDYPSLLADPTKKVRHEEANAVAEQLRAWAKRANKWMWGAHQSTGEGMNTQKTQRLDNYHVADSKGVAKTADLLVSLNPRDDGASLLWYVAKCRHGTGGAEVGPLPHDFCRGRVVMTRRQGWPY